MKSLSHREKSLVQLTLSICEHETVERFHAQVLHALENGNSLGDVKELILQLSIYIGLPKALQSLKRLKTLDVSDFALREGSLGPCSEIPTFAPSSFNFFEHADIQEALYGVDADFAEIALRNAIPLSARPGLTPQERALVILASDVYNRAFEGPFQIHVEMLFRSGGNRNQISEILALFPGTEVPWLSAVS